MSSLVRLTVSLALLIACFFLTACSSGSSSRPIVDTSLTLQEQLQGIVDEAVASGLPGVSLHVQNGTEHINVVAGLANKETSESMSSTTLFHAASIGKTFTATLVFRLVDMSFVQLEDPIDSLLDPAMSALIPNSDSITVEMLLAHTSGIQDYLANDDFIVAFAEFAGRVWTPTELIGYIDNTTNNFEPGAQYEYSNTNYLLLGLIAERLTGMSLGMALRDFVFQPAGLENTFGVFEDLGQPMTGRGYLPISYIDSVGIILNQPTVGSDYDTTDLINSEGLGDAPLQSIPSDLNAFIRTLIDSETLVPGELKTKMLTVPEGSELALGLFVSDENGGIFGSTGKGFGVRTAVVYFPSQNVSFATIVNGSFGDYDQLYEEYTERLDSFLARL